VFIVRSSWFITISVCGKKGYVHLVLAEIGFVWLCIGFVSIKFAIGFIFIFLCIKNSYIHLVIWKIGFVLHKIWPICRGFSTSVEKRQETGDRRENTGDRGRKAEDRRRKTEERRPPQYGLCHCGANKSGRGRAEIGNTL
jgi:hypothetical protein